MDKKYLELGICEKPHGIKGAFTFKLYNTQESTLKKGSPVYLVPMNSKSSLVNREELFHIDKITFGHKVMVYLEGISDRNQVEQMVPFKIFVKTESLPVTEENEFYVRDLIGLEVFENITNKKIGHVADCIDNSAQVILEIRGIKNFDIPFVQDFVSEVDLEQGFIKVKEPRLI